MLHPCTNRKQFLLKPAIYETKDQRRMMFKALHISFGTVQIIISLTSLKVLLLFWASFGVSQGDCSIHN